MSKVLFLNIPGNGHVNPTLGLVDGLVKQGEEVTYYCTEEFRERIENAGATFKNYGEIPNILKDKGKMSANRNTDNMLNHIIEVLDLGENCLEYILDQIKDIKFDYIFHSSMFADGNIISQILKIPSISSFEVFATSKERINGLPFINEEKIKNHPVTEKYRKMANSLTGTYNV